MPSRSWHRPRPSAYQRGYTREWRENSALAIQRDGQCRRCGSTEDLTGGHPAPVAVVGNRVPSVAEIVTLCRSCNSSDGARE